MSLGHADTLEGKGIMHTGRITALLISCLIPIPLQAQAESRMRLTPPPLDVIPILDPSKDPNQKERRLLPYRLIWPKAAAEHCAEGSAMVRYTITADGTTRDVEVLDRSAPVFGESARAMIEAWRYKPKLVNGEPQSIPNRELRIDFQLGDPGEKERCLAEIRQSHARFDVPEPQPTLRVPPRYPTGLPRAVEAAIELGFSITEDGSVTDTIILSSETWTENRERGFASGQNPRFERATLLALGQWQYPPPTIKGQPAKQERMKVLIEFRLGDGAQDEEDNT